MENKNILDSVLREVEYKNIKFGELTITLSYHDAKITKYSVLSTETHILPLTKKVVKKEVADAKS